MKIIQQERRFLFSGYSLVESMEECFQYLIENPAYELHSFEHVHDTASILFRRSTHVLPNTDDEDTLA